jgi:sigma-E factor negative regulatory protein RseC
MNNEIRHFGIVVSVSDGQVLVKIERKDACASCKSKKACQLGASENQFISVKTNDSFAYTIGEEVNISMKTSLGFKAIAYAYLFPFLVLIASFLLLRLFTEWEWLQVLSAFLLVALYYGLLYKRRGHLENTFHFFISKR